MEKRDIIDPGDDKRMKYEITEEELADIREARRQKRDKNVERRLKALELRGEGHSGREIGELTATTRGISQNWQQNTVRACSVSHRAR